MLKKSLRPLEGLRRILGRFGAKQGGMAAVEFALTLPLMLLLYVGVVDVSRGVIASRKLDMLSRTISDLTSQQNTATALTSTDVNTIFAAATSLMAPYNTNSLTMTVSAIDIKAKSTTPATCCDALVRWTYTQGGALRPCTTPLTQVSNGTTPTSTNFPASIITSNQTAGFNYVSGQTSYVIIADVAYTYNPIFSQAVSWFKNAMSKTTIMVPRSPNGPITLSSPVNAPTGQSGTICFS